jgi:hypothetical protein
MKNFLIVFSLVLLGLVTSSIAQPPDFTCDPPKELRQVEGWYTDNSTGVLVHYITTYCWDPTTNEFKIVGNGIETTPPGVIPDPIQNRNIVFKAILDYYASTICVEPCVPVDYVCWIKIYPCWTWVIDPHKGFPWFTQEDCGVAVECEYSYRINCNYPACDGTYTFMLLREFTFQLEQCPPGCVTWCTGGAIILP